ncbi:MAG TPA: hypothetical protein VH279_07225 [Solirubrobacteraceae bacterium]|jgi:hypothetical protein|nr:hypothetical protein [Solirubrobacteraceae bacterium]
MVLKLGETFTLAGIGAMLMGVGSALTGWAALRAARKPPEPPPEPEPGQDSEGHTGDDTAV